MTITVRVAAPAERPAAVSVDWALWPTARLPRHGAGLGEELVVGARSSGDGRVHRSGPAGTCAVSMRDHSVSAGSRSVFDVTFRRRLGDGAVRDRGVRHCEVPRPPATAPARRPRPDAIRRAPRRPRRARPARPGRRPRRSAPTARRRGSRRCAPSARRTEPSTVLDRPAVVEFLRRARAERDHRLDGQRHAGREPRALAGPAVVEDVRRHVHLRCRCRARRSRRRCRSARTPRTEVSTACEMSVSRAPARTAATPSHSDSSARLGQREDVLGRPRRPRR